MKTVNLNKQIKLEFSKSLDLNKTQTPVLNPLDLFPSKHDSLTRGFFPIKSSVSSSTLNKFDNGQQWLHQDRINPDFGINSQSQEAHVRKAYRRLQANSMFSPPKANEASLTEITKAAPSHKKYIIIEESRLAELTKFENVLRQEKELLGEQCTWVLNDIQISARHPLPATRNAVHNLCEQQMKSIRSEIMTLNHNWLDFCKQNHYNKPHLFLKDSYVKCAPVSQRAMKLRLVKEAAETWRLRKDRDTMLYEDDLSYLTGKYCEALVRRKDYERYYILATRYGIYTEEEYNMDPRPGRRYFKAATKGALKFQLAWDRYWAMTKLRRYRAARIMQKYWRRFSVYRKLHPIIRMRLKIGKKTYYIFCFALWKEYNRICRRIKEAINFHFSSWTLQCFNAWKQFIKDIRNNRERILHKMILRNKNSAVYNIFIRWQYYLREIKSLKRRLRRLFGFPHFDIWCNYVKWNKHIRHLNKNATTIISIVRSFIEKKRLAKKKHAQIKLKYFTLICCARRILRFRREKTIRTDFNEWFPDEVERRTVRMNDLERQRILRRQQIASEKEKVALKDLKKHLRSYDGKLQLKEIVLILNNSSTASVTNSSSDSSNNSNQHRLTITDNAKKAPNNNNNNSNNNNNNSSTNASHDVVNDLLSAVNNSYDLSLPSVRLTNYQQQASNRSIMLSARNLNNNNSNSNGINSNNNAPTDTFTATSPNIITKPNKNNNNLNKLMDIHNSSKTYAQLTYYEKIEFARKLLLNQCADITRLLEIHNYDCKFPPPYKCPDLACTATFTTELQYHNHMLLYSSKHYCITCDISYFNSHIYKNKLASQKLESLNSNNNNNSHNNNNDINNINSGLNSQINSRPSTPGDKIEPPAPMFASIKLSNKETPVVGLTNNNNTTVSSNLPVLGSISRQASSTGLLQSNSSSYRDKPGFFRQGTYTELPKITETNTATFENNELTSEKVDISEQKVEKLDKNPTLLPPIIQSLSRMGSVRGSFRGSLNMNNLANTIASLNTSPVMSRVGSIKNTLLRTLSFCSTEPVVTTTQQLVKRTKDSNYDVTNDYSYFHILIRHHKGHDLVRSYLLKLYGYCSILNIFDCYLAIQEWKKVNSSNSNYNIKALNIYELFLIKDSDRKIDFYFPESQVFQQEVDLLASKMSVFKSRSSNSFYVSSHATRNMFREFFNMQGKEYRMWSDVNILNPTIFNTLEFGCFIEIFKIIQYDTKFKESVEYKQYCDLIVQEAELKQANFLSDYKTFRNNVIKEWTHHFKFNETQMYNKACSVVDIYLNREVERLCNLATKYEVKQKVIEISRSEQSLHEFNMLLSDEALYITEENIIEYVYTFYTTEMLNTMLTMPELVKGMLEYSGLVKSTLKKKLVIDMNIKNESNDWFKTFFQKTNEKDYNSIPISTDDHVIKIQKFARGMLGRNKVRKIFVKTYVKKYDASTQLHYFCNLKTGESQWERPKFMLHLYPKTTW